MLKPSSLAWCLVTASVGACAAAHASPQHSHTGVLILAHGGSAEWNESVRQTVEAAGLNQPSRIAFGMGMHGGEVEAMQQAVDALTAGGAQRIVAVPLLVSSHSEVMRQYEYLLGAREHGPWEDHAKPIRVTVPITIATPLNDDPAVAEVLLDRAREVSRQPQQETVVLVAHGPNGEEDNTGWLAAMQRVADRIREAGGFRAVVPVTMRDDASQAVRDAATQQIRELVRRLNRQGRTLIVPLLLANGGVEMKIPKQLTGLHYVYRGKALLPHPKVSAWIARQVEVAATSRL